MGTVDRFLTPGSAPTGIVGAVQTDTLGRSLLIALVVVSPYAIYKWRQVQRVRRAHEAAIAAEAAPPPPDEPPPPALEDVVRDIAYVEQEAKANGGAMLVVPHVVTVSDRPAAAATVDLLVRDALRRSGLVVTAELDTDEGRLFECRPVATGPGSAGPDSTAGPA